MAGCGWTSDSANERVRLMRPLPQVAEHVPHGAHSAQAQNFEPWQWREQPWTSFVLPCTQFGPLFPAWLSSRVRILCPPHLSQAPQSCQSLYLQPLPPGQACILQLFTLIVVPLQALPKSLGGTAM